MTKRRGAKDKSGKARGKLTRLSRTAKVSRQATLRKSTTESRELAEARKQLSEALEQQTATSEVLQVIRRSPGELEPVFQAMLENATRVCEATFGAMYLFQGDSFRAVAIHGEAPKTFVDARRQYPVIPLTPGTTLGRVAATKQPVQISDVQAEPAYHSTPAHEIGVERGGLRTVLSVPILKEGQLIGAFNLFRQEVRPFTDKQIELVSNFAAQAVIAIENTRLLNELRQRTNDLTESLEQQTATTEVLKVISSSPGDLGPIFQAILENATRICEAKFANLLLFQDGAIKRAALYGAPSAWADDNARDPMFRPGSNNPIRRMLTDKQMVIVPDMRTEQAYLERDPTVISLVEKAGARTVVLVPLLKDGELVGAITIYRQEVRPFTDKQIELVQTFAAQAVIAIENTRLLNELRQRTDDLTESLEQQTATADVLKIISSSPGELKPVFEAMLDNAVRICGAKFANLFLRESDLFRVVATHGTPAAYREMLFRAAIRPGPDTGLGMLLKTKRFVQIDDITKGKAYADRDPLRVATVELGGGRTLAEVPLLKDGELIGSINIYHREVKPFTDKQIALLTNFAAQAVIAIENTRLLNELRESLQQQTATAEVLKVISSSPGELEPVFNAMLENATRICDATFGTLSKFDGELFHHVAELNVPPRLREFLRGRGAFRPQPGSVFEQLSQTKTVAHIGDDAARPTPSSPATLGGARTTLGIPMLKDDVLVGAFFIYRQEVRPFTDKQIEVAKNFAAQAVIAIENTRLLTELRESLQQQTATADVLKVISRSTFDLKAVLNTLVASACQLCEAEIGNISCPTSDGLFRFQAHHDMPRAMMEDLERRQIRAGRGTAVGRVLLQRTPVHIEDVLADPDYELAEMSKLGGFRTLLAVPLLRGGEPIGVFVLVRRVVRPFTERQIELVSTFADQAVIAIENVRLFDEIQDKSRQLAEASQHKSQFLASMSHELRTPLNAILGYTELIADGIYGALPEKTQAVLKRVESNGRHLLGLINAVLDLSKIEAGQLTLDLADYSLGDVTQTVYNAVEALAIDKKLAFKADVPPGLPRGRGDERRLAQVLLNLVGNAIKFTDAGEVVINASASNGAFNLSVRDTGPGISAADQAKLFQEFQQADNSLTRKKGGTGLGLAISKRIIEMHGGRIWVESEVGRGSTFFVTLPVHAQMPPAGPAS